MSNAIPTIEGDCPNYPHKHQQEGETYADLCLNWWKGNDRLNWWEDEDEERR